MVIRDRLVTRSELPRRGAVEQVRRRERLLRLLNVKWNLWIRSLHFRGLLHRDRMIMMRGRLRGPLLALLTLLVELARDATVALAIAELVFVTITLEAKIAKTLA